MKSAAALAAAMTFTLKNERLLPEPWISHDDYPYGYRAAKRVKPADPDKRAKRKAQRRARRITRNSR